MKRITVLFLSLIWPAILLGQSAQHPLWMRHPAISPEGNWIAFEYKGDLFKVSTSGGAAIPLTMTPSYESNPVWSHDGSEIAFSSDRYGNFDIYVMESTGGKANRLTFHSAKDIPYDFTLDNKNVIFGTARNDIYTSVRFPNNGLFMKLYKVPVRGGRSVMINSAGTQHAHYRNDGKTIIFQDRKGYESEQRKHEHASVTRDIWTFNLNSNHYQKLTHYNGDDLEPIWGESGRYYFLSDRNGDLNVYQSSLSNPAQATQLTHFSKNPVRSLSRADNGTLAFAYNGELYTKTGSNDPQKIPVTIQADFAQQATQTLDVRNSKISEMALSPDGEEIAFVFRGDIFATSVDGNTTKRLTNTPYQERMIDFSPDGRTIVYSFEKNNSWDIAKVEIANEDEPYFYGATVLNSEPVIVTANEEFQPLYSPDGKKIAYLENRNILKVYNFDSKKTTTVIPKGVNFSYSDGDQYYTWSPDSQWLLAESNEGYFTRSEVALLKADGSGERHNLTQSGFGDVHPKWSIDGKAMSWISNREGMKNLSRGSQGDVYALFFDQKAFDRYNLSKEDLKLVKKEEKKDTTNTDKKEKDKKKEEVKPLDLNLKNLESRTKRLTINSSLLSDFTLTKDGEKLYYLAKYDEGYDLWVTEPRTHKTKVLAQLNAPGGGSLTLDKDEKNIFVLAGGSIRKVDVSSGKASSVSIHANMTWDGAGERTYIFEHAWRQVKKRLFDPNMQGVDWQYYHDNYERFLPYINNDYDFSNMLSEMLGELNVSHTGCYLHPHYDNPDKTAALGMLYDEKKGGNGLVVKTVLVGGPMDKADTKVKPNDVLQKIDGTDITSDYDWAKLLNHKAGKFTRLTLYRPDTKSTWDEVIKPISSGKEQQLLYKRWIHTMSEITDSLSNGEIGYVHVKSMNDNSYRTVFGKVLGENYSKKALVVDTRFNGGGWLHDNLATFLDGQRYLKFAPQGNVLPGGESTNKWDKPSVVLMSQSNYSDAFLFPFVYKELGIGKLVGMPVPGTGTAVWWENQIDTQLTFGIPMVATKAEGADHFTENHQLAPDIRVPAPYNKILHGKDPQLERAVHEMVQQAATN